MKLAKKVLSVVLALVLALGAFAVVGSANGSPDADYQVKIWLTGSVGSATWTSNSKVVIDEGDESDPGAEIEVQPGDTVFVRLYVQNNYYVQIFQTNLFYSAELIDAAEEYAAQRGRAITTANLKKIHIWNEDHYWAGLQGTSYSAQNAWSLQQEGFNTDVAQNWPTDDEGNNLFKIDEWKFNRLNNLATEGVGETSIWEDDVHLIMMPVKVPADAKPGDTFYVTIPEGLEQRSAKPYGALRLTEIGIADGEDEPSDIVDTNAATQPNMQYSDDNQYYDFSEATLTLVVPGASEPELDFSALNAKIAEAAEALKGNITDDSKAALNDAIDNGTAALEATSQDDIDAAVTELVAAIDGAEDLANFAELNAATSVTMLLILQHGQTLTQQQLFITQLRLSARQTQAYQHRMTLMQQQQLLTQLSTLLLRHLTTQLLTLRSLKLRIQTHLSTQMQQQVHSMQLLQQHSHSLLHHRLKSTTLLQTSMQLTRHLKRRQLTMQLSTQLSTHSKLSMQRHGQLIHMKQLRLSMTQLRQLLVISRLQLRLQLTQQQKLLTQLSQLSFLQQAQTMQILTQLSQQLRLS